MGHFEMVTTLLAAAVLMDIFQVMKGTGSMLAPWAGNPVTQPEASLQTERSQNRQMNLLEAAFPLFCRLHMW